MIYKKKILSTFFLIMFVYSLYSQNFCNSDPIPGNGFKLGVIKRFPKESGCICYWIEYDLVVTKLKFFNLTNKEVEISRAAINWRQYTYDYKNIRLSSGQNKEFVVNGILYQRAGSEDKTIPKPSANVSWKFVN